jgi:hypothetical protein
MSESNKSPFFSFLKIVFCLGLIFGAYVVGDNLGYKRGFQETANFTTSKLGIDKMVVNHYEYGATLDTYIEENREIDKSLDKSLDNIFSTKKLGNLVNDFINGLLGE